MTGALDTSDVSSATSSPPSSLPSPRSPPSSLPPARPGRPRPPLVAKSSPSPHLVSLSNSIAPSCKESVHQNTLPQPLSPTLVSSPPLLTPKPPASADQTSSNPPLPALLSSKPLLPPDVATSSCAPQLLTPFDRLVGSSSVWQPEGLSEDQITAIVQRTTAGVCPKRNISN